MNTLIYDLSALMGEAFAKCGYDAAYGQVSSSDRPELCQFQCNGAFRAAKLAKKAPLAVAGEVAEILAQSEIIAKAEAVKPGFVNFDLTDEYLAKRCMEVSCDEHLGVPQLQQGRKVVVDYGGPNVAKPLHIGHLRAAIIGEAVKRIHKACGAEVIGDIHMGDWGLQMGLVIAQMSEKYADWRCFAEDFDPAKEAVNEIDVNELNEIYPYASARSKTDEEFSIKAHRITAQLQAGHPGYTAVWKEIMRVSVADLKRSYERLNVDFEVWYGESDAEKYVEPLLKELGGHLRESDGAQVVDVELEEDTAPVPPIIIKKSDGSNMYATTDLATILQRQRDWAPDEILYVVDKRQSLHFTQVFRCAKKAGIVPDSTKLEHLGFGTMNGADGKPYKTREGGVMQLSVLIDSVTQAAREKLASSEFVNEADLDEYARKVGVAALKFGDLINQRAKDYIFDIDKFLSFEGKTGVYLLYTVTRMNSILRKADSEVKAAPAAIHGDADRDLMLTLLLTGEAYQHAANEGAPNYICDNAYRIAAAFSRFYHDNHILTEEDAEKRADWLALCALTRRVMIALLECLAIDTVENM